MTRKKRRAPKPEGKKIEQDIRSRQRFTLAEAIGRLGGGDVMKGASPVSRKRQAELQIKQYLESQLVDGEGSLRTVLVRRVTEGQALLQAGYEEPLSALHEVLEAILASEARLESIVHESDVIWGRANVTRPHFRQDGQPPHPEDPYTVESVRTALAGLLEHFKI
ncbi:MAG: hypothetical protein ACYTHJ_07020 [Planctomycetota bacterium]|jgi:hypothetical protein